MSLLKIFKDKVNRAIRPNDYVPEGLFELSQYFRLHGPINFHNEPQDGVIVAKSTNFRHGSIITSGKNEKELDENVRDAILTAFEVPSAYADKVELRKVGEESEYALA